MTEMRWALAYRGGSAENSPIKRFPITSDDIVSMYDRHNFRGLVTSSFPSSGKERILRSAEHFESKCIAQHRNADPAESMTPESSQVFPPRTPERVQNAHKSIVPIYEFLAKYQKWIAKAGPDCCDFALGNPQTMPLEGFATALRDAAIPRTPAWYAYKTNEAESRATVCTSLKRVTGLEYPPENIFMTNGATGAHLVTMNALIGPDDEVIFNDPPWFFYEGMILQSGGRPVSVNTQPHTFDLDITAIDRAITDHTRFIIINSPNNPTGKIYSPDTLQKLSRVLSDASSRIGHLIYLVSDEVYRAIVYDGRAFHSPVKFYKNSIMIYSYGKTLLTPGERVGYIALSPDIEYADQLRTIFHSTQILSGWAMTSALLQHALPDLEKLSLDVNGLQRRRDRFVSGLRDCGYEVSRPEGGFYITPKSPVGNDQLFSDLLAEERVLCLPGSVVKMPGYFRVSLTGSDEMIERALPIFASARAESIGAFARTK
jgi:aspartate aminotransferase